MISTTLFYRSFDSVILLLLCVQSSELLQVATSTIQEKTCLRGHYCLSCKVEGYNCAYVP